MFSKDTRILVVDDMRTMRIVIKKTLASLQFTNIVEADDGTTAWSELEKAMANQTQFHLIVSDWTMPKMTGLDLLKKVRTHAKLTNLPFLMVTAEADAAQVKEAIAAGVSGYITKPFSADTLKEKLAAMHERITKAG